MYEVGRLCVKIAGRDAGKKCVIVEVMENRFVLIDGQTRRRKCNVAHLEPLKETIKITKGADHKTVASEFKKLKLEVRETKPKTAAERPMKVRKQKSAEEKAALQAKKEEKKKAAKAKEKPSEKKEAKAEEKKPEPAAKEKPAEKKEEPKKEVKPAAKKPAPKK